MQTFTVPAREEVSPTNQVLFDNLQKAIGRVPNLYATMAYSKNALGTYLALQSAGSSLKAKEKEVINLVVSQVNHCDYCLAAHTTIAKLNGFSDEQVLEIRSGSITFDNKLHTLAALTKSFVVTRGKPDTELTENFFAAGYTRENLVDAIVIIGDKIITNFLHGVTQIPVDWPSIPDLQEAQA